MSVALNEPTATGVPPGAARRRHSRRSRTERDALVVRFRPYVLKIARETAQAISFHVEIDDLIGWGHMGLMEAASRFDASRGVTFRTFAHRRIRGAMFDGLRKQLSSYCVRFDDDDTDAAGNLNAIRWTCGDASFVQDQLVLERELREQIHDAMRSLTALERQIVELHYFDGQPVQSLVGRTRFSKSWLSRVHSRALAKMRVALMARSGRTGAYL